MKMVKLSQHATKLEAFFDRYCIGLICLVVLIYFGVGLATEKNSFFTVCLAVFCLSGYMFILKSWWSRFLHEPQVPQVSDVKNVKFVRRFFIIPYFIIEGSDGNAFEINYIFPGCHNYLKACGDEGLKLDAKTQKTLKRFLEQGRYFDVHFVLPLIVWLALCVLSVFLIDSIGGTIWKGVYWVESSAYIPMFTLLISIEVYLLMIAIPSVNRFFIKLIDTDGRARAGGIAICGLFLAAMASYPAVEFIAERTVFKKYMADLQGPFFIKKDNLVEYANEKGTKFLYDKRYNCINCGYSIQKGSIVFLDDRNRLKVLATSNLELDKSGRAPSSIKSIPEGFLLLSRYTDPKDQVLVPVSAVKGKVIVSSMGGWHGEG